MESPHWMGKMIPDEDVVSKNMAELALKYNIKDPKRLTRIFSAVDPDEEIPVSVELMVDGNTKPQATTLKIKAYNMASLHDRACVLLVAPRESGKSVLAYQMLATKSYIPMAYVTSTTDGVSGFYQRIVADRFVRTTYDPSYQMQIVASQERCGQIYEDELKRGRFFDPRCIMVEDDCAYDRKMHEDSALDRVGTSGRHFHIWSAVMTQRLQRVSPTFRDNCDLIIVFANDNRKVRECVWQEFGSAFTRQSFMDMWDKICSQPYHAMVIKCRGRDRYKKLDCRIYHFKSYCEDAVDALLGGGEVNEKGEVTAPPKFQWRITADLTDEELSHITDQTELLHRGVVKVDEEESDSEDEEELPFYERIRKRAYAYVRDSAHVFQPSPISLSERWLEEKRLREQKTRSRIIDASINSTH